ncbi:MAG: type I methionyl aminopeptidase [Acidimicrobiia bacterium]|nr:type I methionyl aminopeptidase [Acidimicrobiia bacterium]
MITYKQADDYAAMAIAGAAVAEVLAEVRNAAVPGVSLEDLDRIAATIIRDRGCTPSFLGYHGFPASICASPNSAIVHGIPGDYRIVDGDILSIDAGAIYKGWHGDGAVTFAVGSVPKAVVQLIATTADALDAGIAEAKHGNRVGDIGAAVSGVAAPHGYGVVREYVGHGIGQQMHEEPQIPNYGTPGRGLKLKSGMAVAIEPMFNLGGPETAVLDDEWTVVTADGSLSAHFEHTVAITPDGPKVLTALTSVDA